MTSIGGRPAPPTHSEYTATVERARGHAATLLGVGADRVATGSQVSPFVALAAAVAPAGAEIVCIEGDFSSLVAPFLVRGDLRVRHVPIDALADAIGSDTWLAAYSLVQSATGEVADAASVAEAARAAEARVLVDTTQATGWLPTTDLEADLVVCHSYKWLCSPRGAAFAAFSDRAAAEFTPLAAGWWSGTDPWASCYGPELHLADDASRFDVSPAWHAWVGAEAALGFAASLDAAEVRDHAVGTRERLPRALGLEPSEQRDRGLARRGRRATASAHGRWCHGVGPRRSCQGRVPPLERRGGRRPRRRAIGR